MKYKETCVLPYIGTYLVTLQILNNIKIFLNLLEMKDLDIKG